MRVLVVNAGSTSLKLRVVEPDDGISASEDLGAGDLPGLERFVGGLGRLDVIGHRVVHGGPRFTSPVLLDGDVRRDLERLSDLAPLHNPPAVRAIDDLAALLPAVAAVACFDTAFHATLPDEAWRYALPAEWVERWGIRRYGFHGLSCEWAVRRSARMLGRDRSDVRAVVCHLGGGASATAVVGGRSVDTTMGFTPTEGLVMATRSGDVDPGAVAWLADRGVPPADLVRGLDERSGLMALTGGSSGDMRQLLERRRAGDPVAAGAVGVFLHRLAARIASMAASARGVDSVVFTGGVGEHAAEIRAETADRLGWMGMAVDPDANREVGSADADISAAGAGVRVLVVHAREELVVAAGCRQLLT